MASYFLKALWYKEWKEHRGKVVLAFCAFSLIPVGSVLVFWVNLHSLPSPSYATAVTSEFWSQFHKNLTTFQGGEQTDLISFFTVIVMAGILVSLEKSRGTLLYALSVPVRRDDWLRTKFWFGLAVILGSYTLLAVWEGAVAAFDPHPLLLGEVLRWYFFMVLLDASVYSIAFLVAVCVTNQIGVFAGTVGILGFPLWLSTVLEEMWDWNTIPNWFTKLLDGISRLSPAGFSGDFSMQSIFLYWYLILVPLCYWAAKKFFLHTKAEFLENFLTQPRLWHVVFGAMSVLIGSYIADMVKGNFEMAHPYSKFPVFLITFILLSAALWFLFHGASVRRRRKRGGQTSVFRRWNRKVGKSN